MTVSPTMRPTVKDDEGLTHCNNILINLSLGKMNGEHKDTSLYKSILLQNLLNRRLVEKVEGIATCQQRRQEMRFILFKRGSAGMCDTAPWSSSASSSDDENEYEDDDMESEPAREPVTNSDAQQGQARLRIRLVMKGNQNNNADPPVASPKRQRESPEEDVGGIKRRCGDHYLSESPQPASIVV